MSETWLKAKDVAKIIDISTSSVLRMARTGELPRFKRRGVIRFSEQEIETWMKQYRTKGVRRV